MKFRLIGPYKGHMEIRTVNESWTMDSEIHLKYQHITFPNRPHSTLFSESLVFILATSKAAIGNRVGIWVKTFKTF